MVQGFFGFGLCLARGENPLHLWYRFRSADGTGGAEVDALLGSALSAGGEGRGQPGRTERLDILHCFARGAARRVRAVLAENLLAAMLGLEVAAGNDALASHSSIRKTAKLMLQFIPGADFIFSGYSAIPKRDNLFGGGNFDAEDFDDYNVLQRDMQIDGGVKPIREDEALAIRRKAARAIQAVYRELGFPAITDEEVAAATVAHSSDDMPERDILPDLDAADRFMASDSDFVTVMQALQRSGFGEVADNILEMGRQRIAADYLQPAAIFDADFTVRSAINDANNYTGPGSGYRPQGQRWRDMQAIPQAQPPTGFVEAHIGQPLARLVEIGPAARGSGKEVVLALGPAFGRALGKTIGGLDHEDVLKAILSGVASAGALARIVRVYHSSDCAAIGFVGARLSGSGIGIGLQSRGTAVIHQKDLAPLNNLELFPQSPSLTLATYQNIGLNAARYALGKSTTPVSVKIDNGARLRLIVKTALLHRRETDEVRPNQAPVECLFNWEPD